MLKRQVDMLEKQLNQALLRENQSLERESFYQEQIEAMQRLLEAPKAHMTTFTDQDPAQPEDPKHYPVPKQVEVQPKQKGFWSRFFKPYGWRIVHGN